MQSRLNDDEHEHDPDALTLPGNKVAERRSERKGKRDPKRRETKANNDDS
jgi:hypothetical protein